MNRWTVCGRTAGYILLTRRRARMTVVKASDFDADGSGIAGQAQTMKKRNASQPTRWILGPDRSKGTL